MRSLLRKFIAGALIGALFIASVPASAQSYRLKSGSVVGNPTAAEANAIDSTLTALFDRVFGSTPGMTLLRGISVWGAAGTVATTKVANYPAVAADCGSTIPLGGNAQFTLTVGAASGFPSGCNLLIVNVDTFGSGRGKAMAINGVTFPLTVLYPGMSFSLRNVNSTWQIFGLPARIKIPGGVFNFFTDFTLGNDGNDGLVAGTGAKRTVQGCLDTITADLDLSAWSGAAGEPSSQSLVVCNMAVGSVDSSGVHWSPHSIVGAQGGAAVMVQGNGGAATISGGGTKDAFGCFLRCSLQIQNVTFQSNGHSCLTVGYYGDVELLSGITFGNCTGGSHISTADHAIVRLSASYTVSGNAAEHYLAQGPSQITTQGQTITVTGAVLAFSVAFADAGGGGSIQANGATFSSFGATTGQRYNVSSLGNILTTTGSATFFPGNSAGTNNCTTGASTIGNCGIYN